MLVPQLGSQRSCHPGGVVRALSPARSADSAGRARCSLQRNAASSHGGHPLCLAPDRRLVKSSSLAQYRLLQCQKAAAVNHGAARDLCRRPASWYRSVRLSHAFGSSGTERLCTLRHNSHTTKTRFPPCFFFPEG